MDPCLIHMMILTLRFQCDLPKLEDDTTGATRQMGPSQGETSQNSLFFLLVAKLKKLPEGGRDL